MTPTLYLAVMVSGCLIVTIASAIVNHVKIKQTLTMDISDEKMLEAEAKVSAFLLKNDLKPGSDIYLITKALKMEIQSTSEQLDGQATLSEPDETGGSVVRIKRELTRREQNFALAHECGHLLNGDKPPINRRSGVNKDLSEQEADYIAAALLMPREEVYNYLIEQGFPNASPRARVKIAKDLCEKYDVDDITAARRIQEVFMLAKLENA